MKICIPDLTRSHEGLYVDLGVDKYTIFVNEVVGNTVYRIAALQRGRFPDVIEISDDIYVDDIDETLKNGFEVVSGGRKKIAQEIARILVQAGKAVEV